MSYTLLDGRAASKAFREKLTEEVQQMKAEGGKAPHLAAILVGHDPASETYVASKVRACKAVGIESTLIRLDSDLSEETLLSEIEEVNQSDIDGIIVQLPLPAHINVARVTAAIDPQKDVDGFHPENIGRLCLGQPCFVSATPKGILMLLRHYKIETSGKHAVVIGRSNIVGRPMGILLSSNTEQGNCTVSICHSKTQNTTEICQQADILIAAIGKPGFVKREMVKDGAVVIDVGITRVKSDSTKSGFKLVGDVDFENVASKCSFITPVPGGVGPMTIVGLLSNTVLAAQKKIYA